MANKKANKSQGGKTGREDPRYLKAIQNRIDGMSRKDALLDAGYSYNTARHHTREVFDRMNPALRSAFAKAGLTLDKASQTLSELFDDPNGTVRLGALKLWKEFTGVEPPRRHEHSGQIDMSISDARMHQTRLLEQYGWLT